MKKSCAECRALDRERCSLGYKTTRRLVDSILFRKGKTTTVHPAEECPKPRTNDRFLQLLDEQKHD